MANTPQPSPFTPPDLALEQLKTQRQQAYAQMLQQQAAEPIPTNVNTGTYIARVSPLQALAKGLMAYMGKNAAEEADQSQADLGQKQLAANMRLFGQQAPASSPAQSASNDSQPSPSTQSSSSSGQTGSGILPDVLGNPASNAYAYMADPGAYMKAAYEANSPTTEMKNNNWMGRTRQQALAAALSKDLKDSYIPPVEVKPGVSLLDPNSRKPFYRGPEVASGLNVNQDASGNVISTAPIAGDSDQRQRIAASNASGAAGVFPGVSQDPNPSASLPQSSLTNTTAPIVPPLIGPGAQVSAQPSRNPVNQAHLQKFQAEQGIKYVADTLRSNSDYAQNAEKRIADARAISHLADVGITGPFEKNAKLVNDFLAQGGYEPAKTTQEANDSLRKYMAQLIQASGGGTDAARLANEMASPNAKMSPGAIKDAADYIAAQNRIGQARQQFLLRFRDDPATFQDAEQEFNRHANPQIFRVIEHWNDPQQRAAALKKTGLSKEEFNQGLNWLHQNGLWGVQR